MTSNFTPPTVENKQPKTNHSVCVESAAVDGCLYGKSVLEKDDSRLLASQNSSIKTELAGKLCVSCGAVAVLRNYDGEYCKDCMQLHLLEKMFVNLTQMQKPK